MAKKKAAGISFHHHAICRHVHCSVLCGPLVPGYSEARPYFCFSPVTTSLAFASFLVTASRVFRPSSLPLRDRIFALFFVTASLACSLSEAVSEIPRRFAARKDRSKESLRDRGIASEAVSSLREKETLHHPTTRDNTGQKEPLHEDRGIPATPGGKA